jgi:NAD-dependent dihydropyrimidine dehydrogenase PreA subunit
VSLFSAAERLAALDRSKVGFDNSRCLHTRDKFSECTACFDVCPAKAITPGKPPVLNTDTCQTCLACLPACPSGAYTADDIVPALLNCAGRLENNAIELVCAKNPAAEQGFTPKVVGVRVRGCLAGLGAGTYMILAALGLEQMFVRTDACEICDWGALRYEIESQVSQTQRLLAPWDKAQALKCLPVLENPVDRPLWEADNPPLSRRDLFRLAARQGQIAIARTIENNHTKSERQPSRDRLRMLGAVAHLYEFTKSTDSLSGMNFAWLSVTEACTACGVCGRACPTGALSFEKSDDETTYTLAFSARMCIGCEICVHVCAQNALSVNHEPSFAQVFDVEAVTLQEGNLIRCSRCRTQIAARAGVQLCPLCEYRRTHPFGSGFRPGGAKLNVPKTPKEKHL